MTVTQVPGARIRARRGGGTWEVRTDRVHTLQQVAVTHVGEAAITRLDVVVERWRPPGGAWVGRPGVAGLNAVSFEVVDSGARVRLETVEPTDAALLLAAVVRMLLPASAPFGSAELTFAPGLTVEAASLASSMHDVLLPGEARDRHVRRADSLVVGPLGIDPTPESSSLVVVAEEAWTRNGDRFEVSVDPTVHRPIGRRSIAEGAVLNVNAQAGGLTLTGDGTRLAVGSTLTAADVAALKGCRAVVGAALPTRIQRQLSACGVLVADSEDDLPDDPLAWQVASVHERRHALRQYGPAAALDGWPSVSVVLVTHRSDHLEHAFSQLAGLRYPRLEIVVGVHGSRVDVERVRDLASNLPHPITVVTVDAERTLGEALNACCRRSEGTLITKMDDDDHYAPEHVWDLVLAMQYSGATLVGKALDWVHVAGEDVTVFRPVYAAEKYADFVAGGTMLISRADLAAVGGWRPVPKSVDRALIDRVKSDGGLVYRAHGLGYVYVRHGDGHTATVSDEHFLTRTTASFPGLLMHPALGTDADR